MVDAAEILARLKAAGNEDDRAGMARFGINPEHALGVRIPLLRQLAKELSRELNSQSGMKHDLAQDLWTSRVHEARILAGMLADPARTDAALADAWTADFDSWDLCDQCCMNLFWRCAWAWEKPLVWVECEAQFTRRAGFALMAVLSWKDKAAPDQDYLPFLDYIAQHAADDRIYVKKAANWALRQVGKRNAALHARAVAVARNLADSADKTVRWVGRDALRELQGDMVLTRLKLACALPEAGRNPPEQKPPEQEPPEQEPPEQQLPEPQPPEQTPSGG